MNFLKKELYDILNWIYRAERRAAWHNYMEPLDRSTKSIIGFISSQQFMLHHRRERVAAESLIKDLRFKFFCRTGRFPE